MTEDAQKILREIVDEVIKEMTATGAISGYQTPNAFRGHRSKKAAAERSMPGGKVVGTEDETDDTTVGEDRLPTLTRKLSVMEEGKSRYKNFKESDMMKTHRKISFGIKEAKKMLGEVEYLLGICERLKNEANVPTENLWKSTVPDMKEMHIRMKNIAKRIHKIGK